MRKALAPEQIARYRKRGFLYPVRVISADEAAVCRQRLEATEKSMGGRAMNGRFAEAHPFF